MARALPLLLSSGPISFEASQWPSQGCGSAQPSYRYGLGEGPQEAWCTEEGRTYDATRLPRTARGGHGGRATLTLTLTLTLSLTLLSRPIPNPNPNPNLTLTLTLTLTLSLTLTLPSARAVESRGNESHGKHPTRLSRRASAMPYASTRPRLPG